MALAVLAIGVGVVWGSIRQSTLNTENVVYKLERHLALEHARLLISGGGVGFPIQLTERFTLISSSPVEQFGMSFGFQIALRDMDGKTLENIVWVAED